MNQKETEDIFGLEAEEALLQHTRKALEFCKNTKYSALPLSGIAELFQLSNPSISNMANPMARQTLEVKHLENADLASFFSYIEDAKGLELYRVWNGEASKAEPKPEPVEEEGFTEEDGNPSEDANAKVNAYEVLKFVKEMKDLCPYTNGLYNLSAFNPVDARTKMGIPKHKRPNVWFENDAAKNFILALIVVTHGGENVDPPLVDGMPVDDKVLKKVDDDWMCSGAVLGKYLTWVSPNLDAKVHLMLHDVTEGRVSLDAAEIQRVIGEAVGLEISRMREELRTPLLETSKERDEQKARAERLDDLVKELGSRPNGKDVRYMPNKTNRSKMKKAIRDLYGVPDNLATYTVRLWMRLCWWYELFYNVNGGTRRPGDTSRTLTLDASYETRAQNSSSFYTTIELAWGHQDTGGGFVERKRRQLFEINVMAGLLTEAYWPVDEDRRNKGLRSPFNIGCWELREKGNMYVFRSFVSGLVGLDDVAVHMSEEARRDLNVIHSRLDVSTTEKVFKELRSKVLELGGGINGERVSDVYMEDPENREKRAGANNA